MDKKKTSSKQEKSTFAKYLESIGLRSDTGITEYDPLKELLDKDSLGKAILECLEKNDPEGVVEMIEGYLYAVHVNKAKASKKAKLPRDTMYKAFKRKNPTIKTLAKLFYCAKESS